MPGLECGDRRPPGHAASREAGHGSRALLRLASRVWAGEAENTFVRRFGEHFCSPLQNCLGTPAEPTLRPGSHVHSEGRVSYSLNTNVNIQSSPRARAEKGRNGP